MRQQNGFIWLLTSSSSPASPISCVAMYVSYAVSPECVTLPLPHLLQEHLKIAFCTFYIRHELFLDFIGEHFIFLGKS